MGTLNHIAVSLPDTITITTTPRQVIFHSCKIPTTETDISIALIICGAILIALLIIGFTTGYCVKAKYKAKEKELEHRKSLELSKLDKELKVWETKANHEATRKDKEHDWKVKYDEKWKEKEHEWEKDDLSIICQYILKLKASEQQDKNVGSDGLLNKQADKRGNK